MRLMGQAEAAPLLAKFFDTIRGSSATLALREDRCFGDWWLDIGSIIPFPESMEGESSTDQMQKALLLGAYEIGFVQATSAVDSAFGRLLASDPKLSERFSQGGLKPKEQELLTRGRDKVRRALDQVTSAMTRAGLVIPLIDANTLSELPYGSPVTLVVDTSAIVQGALDFAVTYLYPMVRIKVPSVVQMELLNSSDNFLRLRRKDDGQTFARLSRMLYEHAVSQGGQRAILRLELQTDTEIERPRVGADPLRGIVQIDGEDKALGVERIQRSFADRLVFETTRDQLSLLPPGHRVLIATADQGLARMALSEGVQPFFFAASSFARLGGRTIPGVSFNPFSQGMRHVSLSVLLWELAVTFGSVRISDKDGQVGVEVHAIGEDLLWQPFHSKQDLLWVRVVGDGAGVEPRPPQEPEERQAIKSPVRAKSSPLPDQQAASFRRARKVSPEGATARTGPKAGSFTVSPSTLLLLLHALHRSQSMSWDGGQRTTGVKTLKQFHEYRRFLLAAGLVKEENQSLTITDQFHQFWDALVAPDLDRLFTMLRRIPSFDAYWSHLQANRPTTRKQNLPISRHAYSSYSVLAELTGKALSIPGEGVYSCAGVESPNGFAQAAWTTYQDLRKGEPYVLTGAWLEELARRYSLHPWLSRILLNEARGEQIIERYVEGATPDTRFEQHTLSTLVVRDGQPEIRAVRLYHGDFLIPGSAGVSIRMEKGRAWASETD